jgi:exopolysaccharide biosynthesis WecB/TagA/CpsF family protein
LKNKLVIKSKFILADIDNNQLVSFVNPASIGAVLDNQNISNEICYFVDGWLLCLVLYLLTGEKIQRVSFDYTSIAKDIFHWAEKNEKNVFFVGGTNDELQTFISKLGAVYPNTSVKCHHGFIKQEYWDDVVAEIKAFDTDLLVVGMGAGLQELFITVANNSGYQGVSFSCGGFIRQVASSENERYYPEWINLLHFRAFYRMYKEPHTIKRYFFYYPKNIITLIYRVILKKLELLVI